MPLPMSLQAFLTDNVCLVTGGAQGIGWALAQALADHGGEVYVCDVDADYCAQAEAARARLPWGARIHVSRCDVTDRAAVTAWVHDVHRATGRLDVVVNNANQVRWQRVDTLSIATMAQMMRVGYEGMVATTRTALPLMLDAGRRGTIVNLGSSVGKLFAGGTAAPYAAVKAAIGAFSLSLQLELRDTPIHVLLVRPGIVGGTAFFREHVDSAKMPRFADFFPTLTPPRLADAVLRAMVRRRRVLDIPGYLKPMYLLYEVAPRLFDWLVHLGGPARSDLGAVAWVYGEREGE